MNIDLPEDTRIHKRLPKEAFYKHLPLTTALKDKFVSDVDRIFVEHSLTKDNLRLTRDSQIVEILLLEIVLKKQEFDGKIVETMARQNPHKLVFLLMHEDMRQLALYHGKLYQTQWMVDEALNLSANGFSLDEIWDGFVEQVALVGEKAAVASKFGIDERLVLQERIDKLEERIRKAEAAAWKEKQPKKKFELYERLQKYRQELEGLRRGEIEDAHP